MKTGTQWPLLPWLALYCSGLILGTFSNQLLMYILCGVIAVLAFSPVVRRSDSWYFLFFACGFCWLGWFSMQHHYPGMVNGFSGRHQYFIGTIDEQVRASESWSTNLVTVNRVQLDDKNWQRINARIVLISKREGFLFREGDRILFHSALERITPKGNPGEFDPVPYWLSKGVRYSGFTGAGECMVVQVGESGFWDALLRNVHNYSSDVIDTFVGEQNGALVKAVLLGDKSDLAAETKQTFANTGAMHMLAVSGLHVGIIAYLLNAVFRYLFSGVKRKYSILLLVLILWLYAFLTGFSPSVTRAVLMFSTLIAGQLMHRQYNALNTLALAALILVLLDPLVLYDIGFQLSFLAMLGIFTVYPLLERSVYIPYRWIRIVWQGTAVGIAAQVFTVPLSLYYFHQFPNYFMLTNLGIMALAGVLLGLAILLLAVGKIPYVNIAVGWLLVLTTGGLFYFVGAIESLPGSVATGFDPPVWWVIGCYGWIGVALIGGYYRKWLYIVPLLWVVPLQWQRFGNMNKQELVVFNANYLTLLINSGTEQVCLYAGEEKGLKKAKYLVRDYCKIHPGSAEFIPVGSGEHTVRVSDKVLKIQREWNYYRCTVGQRTYGIVVSNRFRREKAKCIDELILMPAVRRRDGYQLATGAWHLSLN